MRSEHDHSRRQFLKIGMGAAGTALGTHALAQQTQPSAQSWTQNPAGRGRAAASHPQYQKIHEALEQVKIIDPHCHLRPEKPAADNLADILLYHHVWIELVSSGMDPYEVTKAGLPVEIRNPQMEPMEQCRRILPWLRNIQNTTMGYFVRTILADLYDVDELNESNLEQVYAAVEAKGADPAWQDELIDRRCNIEALISVKHKGKAAYSKKMHAARENLPTQIVNGKRTAGEILDGWEKRYGNEITTASAYSRFVQLAIAELPKASPRLVAWSISPQMSSEAVAESEIATILQKVKKGEEPRLDEAGAFCYYGTTEMLKALRETEIRTVQLFMGGEVLPPHRGITEWDGRCVGAIARIANAFPEFHFNLVTGSEHYIQDHAILAKHIPNVSVAGYWWHTLYPRTIRKSLEMRLDIVPMNKIVGFFSDAYHAEWIYPKLKLVKDILAKLLAERVESGYYPLETALRIIPQIFYENPKRIFNV